MAGEPFETHPEQHPQQSERPIVGAIILIAIGVIWLLSNLGVISHYDIGDLIRLWPLILVYIGVKQILHGSSAA